MNAASTCGVKSSGTCQHSVCPSPRTGSPVPPEPPVGGYPSVASCLGAGHTQPRIHT